MKKYNMKIDFENETVNIYGEVIALSTTSSGLTKSKYLIDNIGNIRHEQITLKVASSKSDKEIAVKLHQQFAHPSSEKLFQLINGAGELWARNEELKEEIKIVSENCQIYKIFGKPPPRSIVELPMMSQFQETVAMVLKQHNGKIIIHLIDLATCLSAAAAVISNKNREAIIKNILEKLISVYVKPQKFLTDSTVEFVSADFLEMAEQLGIDVKTTATESAWSNGVVERHNFEIGDMLDKILANTSINYHNAVA